MFFDLRQVSHRKLNTTCWRLFNRNSFLPFFKDSYFLNIFRLSQQLWTFYCYKLDWLDFPFWALTFVHFLEHKDYKSKVSSQIDEMSSFQMLCTMNLALKTFPRLKNQDHKRTRHWKIFSFVSIICHVEVESLICTFYFLFRLNAELKIVVLICCWFPYCTFLVNSWHEIFTLKFSHSICRRLELSQPLMFRSLPL